MNIEELIKIHGEKHRRLIVDALKFYETRIEHWGTKVDREEYINILIENVTKSNKG